MATKSRPRKTQHAYGWRPDLPDTRDRAYSAPLAMLKKLPRKVDLRAQCPPVLTQGTLGSCTANAISSAHLFNQFKQRAKRSFQPSRLFIYYNERSLEGTVDYDSGAFIRDGFKSMVKQGVCPETQWPYDIPRFTVRPSAGCYKEALKHQALQYLRLQQTLGQLKGCLAEGYPFVFGFTLYQSFESPQVARNGIVPLPSLGESVLGGHATLAVGYSDTNNRFIVQNSWGTEWGDGGYFYIPYSYLTDGDLAADMWTMRVVET